MLNFKGECNFINLKVKGQLKSKFYLAFTISNLEDNINEDLLFLYDNKIQNHTEKISQSTYYLVVVVTISYQCGPGQYYDHTKFNNQINLISLNTNYFISFVCIYCSTNSYKSLDDNDCYPCPTGGRCQDGLLYNLNGFFFVFFSKICFVQKPYFF